MKYFNLYHQALGFLNRRTNETWSVEYDAHDGENISFMSALTPHEIIEYPNKPPQIIWKNYGIYLM
jgi:hypothetical protein